MLASKESGGDRSVKVTEGRRAFPAGLLTAPEGRHTKATSPDSTTSSLNALRKSLHNFTLYSFFGVLQVRDYVEHVVLVIQSGRLVNTKFDF